jgi:hypothetical protein
VSQKPQRPFVPHRTPTTPRPAITTSEFRLYTPFVPGSVRETPEPLGNADSTAVAATQSDSSALLKSIDDFLDTSPVGPSKFEDRSGLVDEGAFEEEPDELPPVEHFMDPLPAVDEFAPNAEGMSSGNGATDTANANTANPTDSGWEETDWQAFDWRAAAALGETASDEATNAWATTDWDAAAAAQRPKALRQTAAHAIATALDEIAQRIRAGELVVPPPGAPSDPSTIAATLAALLGVKR